MIMNKVSLAAVVLAAGGLAVVPASAWAANGPSCDAYSRHCPDVIGKRIVKPPTIVEGEKTTLPFTGAEIVLMTVAGTGAIGAGTVFVVGARRRRTSTV
jgi:hypothetical protein